jgi:1-acyl-sn-glycerol-3-phosphate acyltransferase
VPPVDRVKRDTLSRRRIAEPAAAGDPQAIEFVACGQPLPRHQIRIVDEAGREVPERHEGRLQFRGPSTTSGYFRNPEKTKALIVGDGWLDSGDRAYVVAGDIYVTGRIKDMIIRAGRNIYPQELEEVVSGVEGVRKGCVAVFASRDERAETDRLVVMAETRAKAGAQQDALRQRIAEAALAHLELTPDEIALVPPRTVPKTSSGKIRRTAARELFDSGLKLDAERAVWLQVARLSLAGVAQRLQRVLRIAGGLAYGAWWWLALLVIAAMTWTGVMLLPVRDARHALVHRAARAFLRLTGTPLQIVGRPPAFGVPAIIAANHASYLDAVVMCAALPGRLAFVAKSELSGQLVAGPFLRRLGTLFARRTDTRGGLEDAAAQLAAVKACEHVVSFPEGTLTRMPGLLPFRLGAFQVAAQAGVPVTPVAIRGTRSALRGDQWLPRRSAIHVTIGAPIAPRGPDFAAAVGLRDAVRSEILAHAGEPDLGRERVDLPG